MKMTVEAAGRSYNVSANVRNISDDWLIFMHGWGASKEWFNEAFGRSDLKDYSICAFDFIGYGESDKPDSFSYDLADQALVANALIRSLKPKRLHIIGHSMGGGIGLLCAQNLPDIPTTLISAEGNLGPQDTGNATRVLARTPLGLFRYGGFQVIAFMLRHSALPGNHAWAKSWSKASPKAIHASAQSLVRWSDSDKLLPIFESLKSKAYVYGELSGKKRQYVLPRLQQIRTMDVKRSGHYLAQANPDGFYAAIAKIIGEAK